MEKAKTTPKDFFMWAGAMVALYWSVSSFIFLIFDYINYALPDPLRYYAPDPYQSGVSYEMASLIVLFPVFIILMWLIHRDIKKDHSRSEIWVRRWALMLTLFVAGLSMVVDLIVVLNSFLNGESLTTAFFLKVAVVFLVAAVVFMHFIADFWGFWEQHPDRAHAVGYAAGGTLVLTIFAGFLILGTPAQARLARVDAQKITDLQGIQSQIVYYYQQKQKLPENLNQLNDSLTNYTVPVDPQNKAPYTYWVGSAYSFKLCATFNRDSGGRVQLDSAPTYPGKPYNDGMSDNWQHGAQDTCFIRTIDPDLYPPTNPAAVKAVR